MITRRKKSNKYSKKYNRYPQECYFTTRGIEYIDYKDVNLLRRFVFGNLKIKPRKITNTSAKSQRQLNSAIKKARILGLMPFTKNH